MLYGTFEVNQVNHTQLLKPYLSKPVTNSNIKKIAIIGGGISGATTAHSLAQRGYQVTLFERNAALAQEASG